MNAQSPVSLSWNLLRYSFGAVVLLAGLDKALGTDLIVNWAMYISPLVSSLIPFSDRVFLIIIGIVEVIVALMLLSKYTKLGALLSVVWLLLISLDLLMLGFIDIAIRDILLALSAYVLALLSDAKYTQTQTSV